MLLKIFLVAVAFFDLIEACIAFRRDHNAFNENEECPEWPWGRWALVVLSTSVILIRICATCSHLAELVTLFPLASYHH